MCEYDHDPSQVHGILGIIDALVTGIVNLQIYPLEHPRVGNTIKDLTKRLNLELAGVEVGHRDLLRIGIEDGYIVYDHKPVLGATMTGPRLIQALDALGIGGFEIGRGVSDQDVRAILELCKDRGREISGPVAANRALDHHGGARVFALPPAGFGEHDENGSDTDLSGRDREDATELLRPPVEVYQEVVDLLQGITIKVVRGDQFSIEQAQDRVEMVLKMLNRDRRAMLNLTRYEQYDAFTFGHSVRVSVLAMDFARQFVTDHELLIRIGCSALLHDVGKAMIPFEILHAARRLTAEERTEMERHSTLGAKLLLDVADSDPLAIATAFNHHRTFDGGGYPKSLSGVETSAATRLVKICDVYEALTANRPYKAGMPPTDAYKIMLKMCSDGHFDPGMLREFILRNGIFPVGYEIRLSTGESAVVEQQTQDLVRPVVRTTTSREGWPLVPEDEREIDLSIDREMAGVGIVGLAEDSGKLDVA